VTEGGAFGANFKKIPELWFPVPLVVCMKSYYWSNQSRFLSHLRFLTALLLSVLSILASSVSAAPAQTYHGTLNGGTFYCGGTQVPGPTVTGTWNLSIDPQTPAQLTLDVFYNGSQHLAWGYNALTLISSSGGVYMFSGFGGIATATLDTNVSPAMFSWHVELGVSCPSQYPCNSLTFFGPTDRGGG
jgi:hypothetical protein